MAGIYVHVPFCTQRCVYCDFYFTTTRHNFSAFTQALVAEIESYGREFGAAEPIASVYFGGGTPSLLPLDEIARILATVERHFDTSALGEITLEMNPEDAKPAYLRGLRDLGITRLSLGVQSFFEDDLRFMNRAHDAAQAEAAVLAVRDVFEMFSIDLIFGLPDQPFEYWGANLEKAVRLGAPHLSTYSLTVEERTPLARQVSRGLLEPATDETMRDRFLFTMKYLTERGYGHYEVCSFAREGQRSMHNQNYWRHCNYLGFGPSAHSFWKRTRSLAHRWSNVSSIGPYNALLQKHERPLDEREKLAPGMLADEYVFLGLRLMEDGLDLTPLETDYGVNLLTEKRDALADLEAGGLLNVRNNRIYLTQEGAVVADAVALKLVG